MRRMFAIGVGFLELSIAIGLMVLAFQLPNRERVGQSFARFEQVTQGAQQQIAALQDQVGDLKRPETQHVAEQLSVQIKQITLLLQRSRIDFATLEATGKGLGEVATGLENWSATLDADRVRQMADGFGTAAEFLDENLSASAQQAADGLHKNLPELRTALDESRKVLSRTREAMGHALTQQTEIESLLREVPKLTSTLAERLPKLGESFAKMLRETKRLKEVATSLRQAQKGLNTAADQWPKLKEALQRSAVVLRTTETQVAQLLQNREAYNKGMNGMTDLTEQFASSLPVMQQQLDARLSQQEQALTTLNTGLVEVNAALPEAMQATGDALVIARWLLGLIGLLVAIHGLNLAIMGGRPLPTPPAHL